MRGTADNFAVDQLWRGTDHNTRHGCAGVKPSVAIAGCKALVGLTLLQQLQQLVAFDGEGGQKGFGEWLAGCALIDALRIDMAVVFDNLVMQVGTGCPAGSADFANRLLLLYALAVAD